MCGSVNKGLMITGAGVICNKAEDYFVSLRSSIRRDKITFPIMDEPRQAAAEDDQLVVNTPPRFSYSKNMGSFDERALRFYTSVDQQNNFWQSFLFSLRRNCEIFAAPASCRYTWNYRTFAIGNEKKNILCILWFATAHTCCLYSINNAW